MDFEAAKKEHLDFGDDTQNLDSQDFETAREAKLEIVEQFTDEFEVYDKQEFIDKNELIDIPPRRTNPKIDDSDQLGGYLCDYDPSEAAAPIRTVRPEPKRYECECGVQMSPIEKLRKHIRSVHSKRHKCLYCKFSTGSKANLKRHVSAVHKNNRYHGCHLCDYATSRSNILKEHIKYVHLGLRLHKCNICDTSFSLNENLKKHLNTVHTDKKPHKCHLCDHTTGRRYSLKVHIKNVHLTTRQCYWCEFVTNSKSILISHLKTKHPSGKKR